MALGVDNVTVAFVVAISLCHLCWRMGVMKQLEETTVFED